MQRLQGQGYRVSDQAKNRCTWKSIPFIVRMLAPWSFQDFPISKVVRLARWTRLRHKPADFLHKAGSRADLAIDLTHGLRLRALSRLHASPERHSNAHALPEQNAHPQARSKASSLGIAPPAIGTSWEMSTSRDPVDQEDAPRDGNRFRRIPCRRSRMSVRLPSFASRSQSIPLETVGEFLA